MEQENTAPVTDEQEQDTGQESDPAAAPEAEELPTPVTVTSNDVGEQTDGSPQAGADEEAEADAEAPAEAEEV